MPNEPENPAPVDANVLAATEAEKQRVLGAIQTIRDEFRDGNLSRFQATSAVVDELDKWANVSDEERGRALNSCLDEFNATATGPDSASNTVDSAKEEPRGSSQKRNSEGIHELMEKISRDGGSELGDVDDDMPAKKRRAREQDMPWYQATLSRRPSCVATCKSLKQFSDDLPGTKSLLRLAPNLPNGFPSAQWDKVLRGESIDLNAVYSSIHGLQLNDERKGRLGEHEVVFTVAEAKRRVTTGAEWSTAFRRTIRAITYIFPHRRDELNDYAEYIEGEFAARQANAHHRIITYDHAVRNLVGGGQSILLTDYHEFHRLQSAFLNSDGIEYASGAPGASANAKRGGSSKLGNGGNSKGGGRKRSGTCRRFNEKGGCRFSEEDCNYHHVCERCEKSGHGKTQCTIQA